jgi:hypothetical protein
VCSCSKERPQGGEGELIQSGRLQRQRSSSQGRDGGGSSKSSSTVGSSISRRGQEVKGVRVVLEPCSRRRKGAVEMVWWPFYRGTAGRRGRGVVRVQLRPRGKRGVRGGAGGEAREAVVDRQRPEAGGCGWVACLGVSKGGDETLVVGASATVTGSSCLIGSEFKFKTFSNQV